MAASSALVKEQRQSAWRGFAVSMWQRGVDVRNFIQVSVPKSCKLRSSASPRPLGEALLPHYAETGAADRNHCSI
jgi:hypothetical protein